jgi:hypothetical protein
MSMQIFAMILYWMGLIIAVGGSIWFLIVAFQESVLWGLGCLLVPLVSLFFLFAHWDEAAKPFGVSLGGTVLMILGGALGANAQS